MSVEPPASGGDASLSPKSCKNAEAYALKRLNRADETMRPAQLADEYDCTPSHMRGALRNLLETGAVTRVRTGEYAHSNADWVDDDTGEGVDGDETDGAVDSMGGDTSEDEGGEDASEDGSEASKPEGMERPSADGPTRSEDRDTADGGQEDADMPTAEELERQRALARTSADETEDDEGNAAVEEADVDDGAVTAESGGSFGIPLPVSSTYLYLGFALLAVGVYWFYLRPRMEENGEQGGDQENGQDDDVDLIETTSGLVDDLDEVI